MSDPRREKRIRVDRGMYEISDQTIAVTTCTRWRQPHFAHHDFVWDCVNSLRHVADRYCYRVLIYCFMPDHLHLLVQSKGDENLIELLQQFKSWTTRLGWKHGIRGKIWQPRYYDHILRENEDALKQMRYIAENPVRSGLVRNWNEYPYLGSFEYELQDFDW